MIENSFPIYSGNNSITPYRGKEKVDNIPSDIILGIQTDIGWSIKMTVSKKDPEEDRINIYTKPASEIIQLNYDRKPYEIMMFDVLGNWSLIYLA